jgi:hypothetical protein
MPETSDPEIANLNFIQINPFIWLFTPPSSTIPAISSHPTTVLLCQWMGASSNSRALHNAYREHHANYPSARIVVIRSALEWFTSTRLSIRQSQSKPALDIIEDDPTGENKKILAHMFSNGGGVAFHDICSLYKERFSLRLPVKALVLDSVPGNPTVREAWNAMKVGLPRGVAAYAASVIIWITIGTLWIWTRVMRRAMLIDEMRAGLLNFDIMERDARRLYVFGEKDEIVGWEGINLEAEKAICAGVVVVKWKNETDPHVQYMIKNPERYWEAVKDLWRSTEVHNRISAH